MPPVKAIRLIFLCEVKTLLHSSAKPAIMFTTPFGKPTLSINLANSKRGVGAASEALIIIVFPIARAGASLIALKSC